MPTIKIININKNPHMKRMVKSSRMFKTLLLAGLLAGPMLAFNAMSQSREDIQWSPLDTTTDGNGNTIAYWDDANNWAGGVVPVVLDPNVANTFYNAAYNSTVFCIVTNTTQVTAVGQLMCGFGGTGILVISNNAHFQCGFAFGTMFTGIGFVAGPGTLFVEPGADFTCGSHLWVGQGNNTQGKVIINGGTLHIPGGQLGVSWNGIGGTNYITITNGGSLYLSQWASSTLGYPGNTITNIGIMDIGANSQVVITNNALNFMNILITNHQLIAFEGLGTISAVYNPSANITVLTGLAPSGSDTPIFSLQPSNSIVALGGTATLTAAASPATGYQWLFNSVPLANGGGISGATTATLTIANFSAAQTGVYSVVATNAGAVSQNDRNFASSQGVSVSADSFNLFPVITVNGVNGNTYVSQYATSLTPPVVWTSFSTNTVGAGPLQVVDTASPLSMQRFYRVIQTAP
jgi:Immunoglobulin domain